MLNMYISNYFLTHEFAIYVLFIFNMKYMEYRNVEIKTSKVFNLEYVKISTFLYPISKHWQYIFYIDDFAFHFELWTFMCPQ